MKLRDTFWLWGHPERCFNNNYGGCGNFAESRMTPTECCFYLGISKTFMVPMSLTINRRQYNKSFKALSGVGWECFGADKKPEKVEQIIEEAKEFPNITTAVFDDFIQQNDMRLKDGEPPIAIEDLKKVRERLHNNDVRALDMWMVLYTKEFGLDEEKDREFKNYCDLFDGIIMWTWEEKDVCLIPEKYEHFKKLTPDIRRMFGCYLWNFGEQKQATPEAVIWQLDFYREKIMAGEAEGVVFHTNTMADLDYPAYDAAVKWMEEHGDEEVDWLK